MHVCGTSFACLGSEVNEPCCAGIPLVVRMMMTMVRKSLLIFPAAFEEAEKNAPAIIFIDELDAIAPKRDKVE